LWSGETRNGNSETENSPLFHSLFHNSLWEDQVMKKNKCPDVKADRIEAGAEISPDSCALKGDCVTGGSPNKNKKASKDK